VTSAATREKISKAMLASWRSGTRRPRRTRAEVRAERLGNPRAIDERRRGYEARRALREEADRREAGANVYDLATGRWVTARELLHPVVAVTTRKVTTRPRGPRLTVAGVPVL